jgi:hypothetical protein
MIDWVYFPKSSSPPEFGLHIVAIFEELGAPQGRTAFGRWGMGILAMRVTGRGKIDCRFKIQDSRWGP